MDTRRFLRNANKASHQQLVGEQEAKPPSAFTGSAYTGGLAYYAFLAKAVRVCLLNVCSSVHRKLLYLYVTEPARRM
jgi:hypothetical protein